jgi:hypothetical protein
MYSICWTTMVRISRLTILMKFGSKSALEEAEEPEPGPRIGLWLFWSWMRDFGWLKTTLKCLRTLTRMSGE